MSIEDVIERRKITEVLHFTTNLGLLGMLGKGAILSRNRLDEDQYLEHVYTPNAVERRDEDWFDHVHLSITNINTEFFGYSKRWHEDEEVWWCVVALDPVVLTHPGVYFATTNNIYSDCRRETGEEGLEALFAGEIAHWPTTNVVTRADDLPDKAPTCVQAEALYPEMVLLKHFSHIYVATERHADIVDSQSEILLKVHAGPTGPSRLPIFIRPNVFESR